MKAALLVDVEVEMILRLISVELVDALEAPVPAIRESVEVTAGVDVADGSVRLLRPELAEPDNADNAPVLGALATADEFEDCVYGYGGPGAELEADVEPKMVVDGRASPEELCAEREADIEEIVEL